MKKGNSLTGKIVFSSAVAAGLLLSKPLMGEAALGDRVLKEGMTHSDVKKLQNILKSKGYFTYHQTTNYFGSITKEALIRFQKANNLPATGIADKATIEALKGKKSNAVKANDKLNVNKTLKKGSRGEQVKLLQKKLKQAGYYKGTVDGIYGNQTADAVRRFQKAKKLTVDGIAGKKTLTALNNIKSNDSTKDNNKKDNKNSNNNKNVVLKLKSSGQAVKQLQTDLKNLGFFKAEVTGYFGTITEKAVKDFQKLYGLEVDGVAGPLTLNQIAEIIKEKEKKKSSFNVMDIIFEASEYLGVPYVLGGNTPKGFDCSGLIVYVFNKSEIQLPRTVAQMWEKLKMVNKPQVGDLVFFDTTGGPSHVGIYAGNNQMIHASTSVGVTITDITSKYWSERYLGARRPY